MINKTRGISLISMMVGIVISSFLLLMIAQLSSMSRKNYIISQNIVGLYDNGREAIEFLTETVQMAGFGINQPVPPSPTTTILDSSGIAGSPPPGGYAVLPNWVYIGLYQFNGVQFSQKKIASPANPNNCSNIILTQSYTSPLNFFGLQGCDITECWYDGGTFGKLSLARFTTFTKATVCQTAGPCPGASYSAPYYNCGGTGSPLGVAVYQKLIQPMCMGTSCLFTVTSANPSGDMFAVHFSNPDPNNITTFSGVSVPSTTLEPTQTFRRYIFQVDSATATLQAMDTTTNMTSVTYNANQFLNIVSNVEYMSVLVGESDLYSTMTDVTSGSHSIPTMSRYNAVNTANQYLYRISAVRVALVVRSQDQILPSQSKTLFLMYGNDGNAINYVTPTDGYMRKVFTTTIFFNGYNLPQYQPHCVNQGANYRIKTGGIPFSTTWTTNDQCCGGSVFCTIYSDLSTCETKRMSGGCW